MQITEIKNEKFYREFQINIPFNTVNAKVEEKVVEAAKSFKMPGFREGKTPLSIVRSKIGKQETGKQIQDNISSCIKEIVDTRCIIPSANPDVEIISYDETGGLSVKIAIEIMPEVPEINWPSLQIEKIDVKISDREVNQAKNNALKEFRNFKKADDDYQSKAGDKIVIDFHGKIDGEEFDGNKAKNTEFIIGDNSFSDDFDKNLLGCQLNESKSFDVLFPIDYPKEDIAGKKAHFIINIIALQELEQLGKLSGATLRKLGVESEVKLIEIIKHKLSIDFISAVRMKMKKELFDKINSQYQFDLPSKMVDQDFDILWKELEKSKNHAKNLESESEDELKSQYRKISYRRVKMGLVIANVTRKHSISITQDEIRDIIELQANQNPQMRTKILEFYKDQENIEKIKGPILEEKAFDFILSKINIKNIEMSSDDFVQKVIPTLKENN